MASVAARRASVGSSPAGRRRRRRARRGAGPGPSRTPRRARRPAGLEALPGRRAPRRPRDVPWPGPSGPSSRVVRVEPRAPRLRRDPARSRSALCRCPCPCRSCRSCLSSRPRYSARVSAGDVRRAAVVVEVAPGGGRHHPPPGVRPSPCAGDAQHAALARRASSRRRSRPAVSRGRRGCARPSPPRSAATYVGRSSGPAATSCAEVGHPGHHQQASRSRPCWRPRCRCRAGRRRPAAARRRPGAASPRTAAARACRRPPGRGRRTARPPRPGPRCPARDRRGWARSGRCWRRPTAARRAPGSRRRSPSPSAGRRWKPETTAAGCVRGVCTGRSPSLAQRDLQALAADHEHRRAGVAAGR